jgi:tRNA A-37 threonylcarbamoyl transferase component Bud32
MKRQVNPFVYGGPVPPTHFIGREDIIHKCYSQLVGPTRGSLAIHGESGVGKTSLLHYLRHTALKEGWGQPHTYYVFVYLYCPTLRKFTTTRFWRHILEEVRQEEESAALHQLINELLGQEQIRGTHFQDFLRRLDRQGITLVLLLDGFDWIAKTETASQAEIGIFLSHLRALTNAPDYSLPVFIASRERLNILCHDILRDRPESEFYNGFIFQPLLPFTDAEVDILLERALKTANFELTQADRNLLKHLAGRHPALLQMAGYYLFEKRCQAPLTEQVFRMIVEMFEQEARHYFSRFWAESSLLEQTFLILTILMYLSGQSSLQIDMTSEEIQGLLQRYERTLITLVERGLLQQVEETYQIFSAIFAWWILREVAAESENWLDNRSQTISEELLRRTWQTFIKLAPHLTLDKLTQSLVTRSSLTATGLRVPPRFELQEEIGRGAYSMIYKAFDTRLARLVGIKVLHSHLSAPETEYSQRLLQEARIASHLQHRNIVTIYEVIEDGGQILSVMEYVEGQPLSKLLQEKGPLPLPQVIALIEQAALALDYAHTLGVIHCDIKPANFIVTTEGELKLTDFGIAKRADDPRITQEGEWKGTIYYMSPKQVTQQPLDGRSDLFSLAVVAFEMLTGASPWHGTTLFEVMSNIIEGMPRPLADFGIPAAKILDPIFEKALAKNPDERYQCGKDFAQALKKAVTP